MTDRPNIVSLPPPFPSHPTATFMSQFLWERAFKKALFITVICRSYLFFVSLISQHQLIQPLACQY